METAKCAARHNQTKFRFG